MNVPLQKQRSADENELKLHTTNATAYPDSLATFFDMMTSTANIQYLTTPPEPVDFQYDV